MAARPYSLGSRRRGAAPGSSTSQVGRCCACGWSARLRMRCIRRPLAPHESYWAAAVGLRDRTRGEIMRLSQEPAWLD
jgi:hypothetical protein